MKFESTKVIELGSCAFRQYGAKHSHCQYLHGYQLKAKFWFGCKELDFRNWVVDFGGLKDLKAILQNQFDHTLCVADTDPCLEDFKALERKGACQLRIMEGGVGIEKTAEWCFKHANAFIKQLTENRCWVEKVEVFEHECNSAVCTSVPDITYTKPVHPIHDQELPNISSAVVEQPVSEAPKVTENTVTASAPRSEGIHRPEGVPLRNPVTSGWGNPFKGTSWGV